jgi:hypothetical protein
MARRRADVARDPRGALGRRGRDARPHDDRGDIRLIGRSMEGASRGTIGDQLEPARSRAAEVYLRLTGGRLGDVAHPLLVLSP